MHGVEFVEIAHSELVKYGLGLVFYELLEVLLRVLSLLNFSLEDLFQLMYFVQCLCVALLMFHPLLVGFLLDLLLDSDVAILEPPHSRLQLHTTLLSLCQTGLLHNLILRPQRDITFQVFINLLEVGCFTLSLLHH